MTAYRENAKAHADDGAVHTHISSVPFYLVVFIALVFLTLATVGQSYIDLGELNIVLVILIATAKASLVVSFFMHLRYDNKFNALVFVGCLGFIGLFFAYTMNDTDRRGTVDADQNVKYLSTTGMEAPGGFKVPTAPTGARGAPAMRAGSPGATVPEAAEPAGAAPVEGHPAE